MIDYEKAGKRIRAQRKMLGLTQEVVSEKVGITPSFFSQIESGARKAGINTFLNIANVLCISLDYILGNNFNNSDGNKLDDIEYQVLYRFKNFSEKDKTFILNMMILMGKNS